MILRLIHSALLSSSLAALMFGFDKIWLQKLAT